MCALLIRESLNYENFIRANETTATNICISCSVSMGDGQKNSA